METLLPLLIGGGGLAALIFGALKFRGEEARQVTVQTREIIESMRTLIDEIEEALERCRRDRDRYRRLLRKVKDDYDGNG